MQTPPLSLYIHIPWCLQKCIYCDFNSEPFCNKDDKDSYIDAVCTDIKHELLLHKDRKIHSIFIGGGTPTILPIEKIKQLISTASPNFATNYDTEVIIEANPETVDKQKLIEIKQAGVNRISFGVQTFSDKQLQYLNRAHSSAKAKEIIKTAQEVGISNINIDLMFGLPEQTIEQMLDDIDQAVALNPTHISHYQLTLEPDTKLASMNPQMPSEELLTDMYAQSRNHLAQLGYHNYETSAFAKPGYECRHNLNYWQFGDFIGVGAGAHGKHTTSNSIVRYHKPSDYRAYISSVESGNPRQSEALTEQEIILEFMINAIRLTLGWDKQLFTERTGIKYSAIESKLKKLAKTGLLEISQDIVRPTDKGRMLLDEILGEFV